MQTQERTLLGLWLQVFNLLQITPQGCGGMLNQLLLSGSESCDFQFAVFEIPPADYGSVRKDGRTDNSGEVEDAWYPGSSSF